MDLNGAFTGITVGLGLLLAYLALSPEKQRTFWRIVMVLIQIGILIGSAFWILKFAMTAGSPSRLEVVNFGGWSFNLMVSGSSLLNQLANYLRHTRDSRA